PPGQVPRSALRRSRCAPARPSSTTPPPSAWTRRCRWWCRRSTRRLSAAIGGSSPTPTAAPSSPSLRCGPFIASIASAGCSSRPITPARVRELLREAPGVKLVDDAERNYFPMPKDASGQDAILVGRIRNDISDPDGRSISLFVAGDQLLKGAALNAVQIAEALRTG